MKYLNFLMYIFLWSAAVTSLIIWWSICTYLITAKIVVLNNNIPYVETIYYFGVGCTSIAVSDFWANKQKKYEL